MTALLRPPTWSRNAACVGTNPTIFDADDGPHTVTALEICATCPVRLPCARYALENAITGGTWGGLTTRDRQRIANSRGYDTPGAARHGSRSRYAAPWNCRCPLCTEAMRRWKAHYLATRQQASA